MSSAALATGDSSGVGVVVPPNKYLVYAGDIVSTTVTWLANHIPGGNATVGAISTSGL